MHVWVGSAVALALLGATPGQAADNRLIGRWQIVEAVPAPWVGGAARADLAAQGRRMMETEVTFKGGAILSKNAGLACRHAMYQVGDYPSDALFRGALPDGKQDRIARELGFGRADVPSVDVDCAGDHFTFHLRDRDTALFALDDVIYTLKRQ